MSNLALVYKGHSCRLSRRERYSLKMCFAILWLFLFDLAHRNRSDFCDLRLRCPSWPPEIARFPGQEKAMLHCDLRVRWKVGSDLRFRAAISEPKTPYFCGISGDLAPSTRKSLAIAIVRFWCAKLFDFRAYIHGLKGPRSPKHIAIISLLRSYLSPLFLLLGRDPCGDRILRSCLQKGPATAPAN